MNISMTKDELLARLKEQLAIAEAEDRRAAEVHEKEEQQALERFRAKLKAALKWDYKTAKKSRYSRDLSMESPDCPRLEAPFFKNLITSLKLDTREQKFNLSDGGDLHRAVTWLPASRRPKETVCD